MPSRRGKLILQNAIRGKAPKHMKKLNPLLQLLLDRPAVEVRKCVEAASPNLAASEEAKVANVGKAFEIVEAASSIPVALEEPKDINENGEAASGENGEVAIDENGEAAIHENGEAASESIVVDQPKVANVGKGAEIVEAESPISEDLEEAKVLNAGKCAQVVEAASPIPEDLEEAKSKRFLKGKDEDDEKQAEIVEAAEESYGSGSISAPESVEIQLDEVLDAANAVSESDALDDAIISLENVREAEPEKRDSPGVVAAEDGIVIRKKETGSLPAPPPEENAMGHDERAGALELDESKDGAQGESPMEVELPAYFITLQTVSDHGTVVTVVGVNGHENLLEMSSCELTEKHFGEKHGRHHTYIWKFYDFYDNIFMVGSNSCNVAITQSIVSSEFESVRLQPKLAKSNLDAALGLVKGVFLAFPQIRKEKMKQELLTPHKSLADLGWCEDVPPSKIELPIHYNNSRHKPHPSNPSLFQMKFRMKKSIFKKKTEHNEKWVGEYFETKASYVHPCNEILFGCIKCSCGYLGRESKLFKMKKGNSYFEKKHVSGKVQPCSIFANKIIGQGKKKLRNLFSEGMGVQRFENRGKLLAHREKVKRRKLNSGKGVSS